MPYWVQLTTYDGIKRLEKGVLNGEILHIYLYFSFIILKETTVVLSLRLSFTIGLRRRTSANVASMHSTSACCILSMASVIGCRSSTTSPLVWAKLSDIKTWNLGHKWTFRSWSVFSVFCKGAKPVVNASGWSDNALMKPSYSHPLFRSNSSCKVYDGSLFIYLIFFPEIFQDQLFHWVRSYTKQSALISSISLIWSLYVPVCIINDNSRYQCFGNTIQ